MALYLCGKESFIIFKRRVRMSSEAILEAKKAIVAEITEKMQNAVSFVIVDYKGINVAQVTELRERARKSGIDYKIYKNTFARFAARNCGYDDLVDKLEGPSAIAFSSSDAVAPAKLISEFVKEFRLQVLEFKGGVIDKKVSSPEELTQIAQLPSKEVLLSQVVGSFNAPIAKLAYAINALKEKLESAS
jgi:large subunit ribosomal protein L10